MISHRYMIIRSITVLTLTLISVIPGQNAFAESAATSTSQLPPDDLSDKLLSPLFSGSSMPTQSIDVGYQHACGLHPNGNIYCWGYNDYGQTEVPDLPNGTTYIQVSVGSKYSCGLRSDGSAVCWGHDGFGNPTAPQLPGTSAYTQISAGTEHACGLHPDGTIDCAGNNDYGQADVPALPAGLTYTQVSTGPINTCGLRSDGSLVCWGNNTYEQSDVPVLPQGLTYTQVSSGVMNICALRSNGTLVCWGDNSMGQTNVPALPNGLSYTQVSAGGLLYALRSDGAIILWPEFTPDILGISRIPALPEGVTYTQVSGGMTSACGLRTDSTVVCWGATNADQVDPTQVPGSLVYQQVSAGIMHTCGLRSDGTLDCWGDNTFGQSRVPLLPNGVTYTEVSAGGANSCGLRSNGTLICWGDNSIGQTYVPALPGGVTYTQVSVGGAHICGRSSNGDINCWSDNTYGQSDVPDLSGGLTYSQVSAGLQHTCGLRSDGTLDCWGANIGGQTDVPVLPIGMTYTQVSTGGLHTCAVRSDNTLLCWGDNGYGQTVIPPSSYTQVSCGIWHTCAVASSGEMACWGRNDDSGEPGQNNYTIPLLPANVTYVQASAGGMYRLHSCGLRSDGVLLCWGRNTYNQAAVPGLGYATDTVFPSVASISLIDPNPTGAARLHFDVTFNEYVVGINAADFALTTTGGISGEQISSVTGSGKNYSVTVDLLTGDGNLRLDVVDNDDIWDGFNNPLGGSAIGNGSFLSGPAYTLGTITTPTIIFGDYTIPPDGSILVTGPSQITLEFSEDVLADGSSKAANNPLNYMLVEAGANNQFTTESCAVIDPVGDRLIPVNEVIYSNQVGEGPFLATLNINNGNPLPAGVYQLFICGTTSIYNLTGNLLNNGSDSVLHFTVRKASPEEALLPSTGFPPGRITALPPQIAKYADYDQMWLEIPGLDVNLDIIGVPLSNRNWDVTWLGSDAGWLEGTAFPTWDGNSVITAHVWDTYNQPGPFYQLKTLKYGDQIKIHAFDEVYTYEIRESKIYMAGESGNIFQHETLDWVTLVTCEAYDPLNNNYLFRRVVRAVLSNIE